MEDARFNSNRACRLSRSEIFVIFSETRENTSQDPLERPPRRAYHPLAQVPRETIGHKPYNQSTSKLCFLEIGLCLLKLKVHREFSHEMHPMNDRITEFNNCVCSNVRKNLKGFDKNLNIVCWTRITTRWMCIACLKNSWNAFP